MTVIDFTLKHVQSLNADLVDALNSHKYPMTEAGAAILVSAGIRALKNVSAYHLMIFCNLC